MAIFDTMQSLNSPVTTHCVGYAYNLAAFLLAAGEKVTILFIRIWSDNIVIQPYHGSSEEIQSYNAIYAIVQGSWT